MPRSKLNPVISFRPGPTLRKKLDDAARRDDRTLSSFVRRLVASAMVQYDRDGIADPYNDSASPQPSYEAAGVSR